MKKIKTENIVVHVETDLMGKHLRLFIDVGNRHEKPTTLIIDLPDSCVKHTINDTGMAKHILNYFIKD